MVVKSMTRSAFLSATMVPSSLPVYSLRVDLFHVCCFFFSFLLKYNNVIKKHAYVINDQHNDFHKLNTWG